MSDRLPSQLARAFVDAAEDVADALQRDTRRQQQTELGFEVEERIVELGEGLRGKYDVTRLERDHPQLVNLITWLLSLPGMTHQAIAEACGKGVCWETVAAIAATRREPIREFKLRMAAKLRLVLDASLGGLMEKAATGKLTPLDFKLLVDALGQLDGEGHLIRFEGQKQETPARTALRELMEGPGRMVFDAEVIPQLGAGSAVGAVLPVQVNASSQSGDCLAPVSDA